MEPKMTVIIRSPDNKNVKALSCFSNIFQLPYDVEVGSSIQIIMLKWTEQGEKNG